MIAISLPGAECVTGGECVTVADGRITYGRFVFDRAPFDAARRAAN
jgi:hypothetical protein